MKGIHLWPVNFPAVIRTSLQFCCINYDILARGNIYKPQRSREIVPHNAGIELTCNVQTEATWPATSCPARSFRATETLSKRTVPTARPRRCWTTDNLSEINIVEFNICVNFDLDLSVYIFCVIIWCSGTLEIQDYNRISRGPMS